MVAAGCTPQERFLPRGRQRQGAGRRGDAACRGAARAGRRGGGADGVHARCAGVPADAEPVGLHRARGRAVAAARALRPVRARAPLPPAHCTAPHALYAARARPALAGGPQCAVCTQGSASWSRPTNFAQSGGALRCAGRRRQAARAQRSRPRRPRRSGRLSVARGLPRRRGPCCRASRMARRTWRRRRLRQPPAAPRWAPFPSVCPLPDSERERRARAA